MGFNTIAVFYNDAMNALEADPEVGQKISRASTEFHCYASTQFKTISTGAIDSKGQGVGQVVACDHADTQRLLLTGGNTVQDLGVLYPYGSDGDVRVRVLKALAKELGYRVSKKPEKK